RIMFIDVLPNLIAPVTVLASLLIPTSIVFEATLSYLGLGVDPRPPSWGAILYEATDYYRVAPGLLLFPALMLLITTLAFNLLGDGVRDALDPRADRRGHVPLRDPPGPVRGARPLAGGDHGLPAVLRGPGRHGGAPS